MTQCGGSSSGTRTTGRPRSRSSRDRTGPGTPASGRWHGPLRGCGSGTRRPYGPARGGWPAAPGTSRSRRPRTPCRRSCRWSDRPVRCCRGTPSEWRPAVRTAPPAAISGGRDRPVRRCRPPRPAARRPRSPPGPRTSRAGPRAGRRHGRRCAGRGGERGVDADVLLEGVRTPVAHPVSAPRLDRRTGARRSGAHGLDDRARDPGAPGAERTVVVEIDPACAPRVEAAGDGRGAVPVRCHVQAYGARVHIGSVGEHLVRQVGRAAVGRGPPQ